MQRHRQLVGQERSASKAICLLFSFCLSKAFCLLTKTGLVDHFTSQLSSFLFVSSEPDRFLVHSNGGGAKFVRGDAKLTVTVSCFAHRQQASCTDIYLSVKEVSNVFNRYHNLSGPIIGNGKQKDFLLYLRHNRTYVLSFFNGVENGQSKSFLSVPLRCVCVCVF